MKNGYVIPGRKSNNVLTREIKALQKQYAKKLKLGYRASYLEKIENTIRTKIRTLGVLVYTSFVFVKKPDEVGREKVSGHINYGPAVKRITPDGMTLQNRDGGIYFPVWAQPRQYTYS